ncbi:unnamed protein product [Leptidea sinapis]|uniref:Uncharacterized protein n=1 Tax=Leptidea sinapis TaxID=189913 RepID=A0A5E4QK19_9NEOP|nr:unnamed protein product [Leptidea sinapis]
MTLFYISSTECFSTYRHHPYENKPESSITSCDELKTLLNLARLLDDQEKPKANVFNPEDLIMKLVNALVVTSTNKCADNNNLHTGNSGSQNVSGSNSGTQNSRGSRDGIFNADFFNPNNPNNVAQFDIGKQPVVGVGFGDTTNGIIGGAVKDFA